MKKSSYISYITLIIIVSVFLGCGDDDKASVLEKKDSQSAVSSSLAEGSPKDRPGTSVLGHVSERPVTRAMFDAYLKFRRVPAKDPKRRKALLDQYIEREALASAIENESLLDKDLI
ncbi:MAG: hypothetical protein GY758_10055, partial [Fuerstiella sp.]|nr:hypothetical protein [Fuerstiella sp.]